MASSPYPSPDSYTDLSQAAGDAMRGVARMHAEMAEDQRRHEIQLSLSAGRAWSSQSSTDSLKGDDDVAHGVVAQAPSLPAAKKPRTEPHAPPDTPSAPSFAAPAGDGERECDRAVREARHDAYDRLSQEQKQVAQKLLQTRRPAHLLAYLDLALAPANIPMAVILERLQTLKQLLEGKPLMQSHLIMDEMRIHGVPYEEYDLLVENLAAGRSRTYCVGTLFYHSVKHVGAACHTCGRAFHGRVAGLPLDHAHGSKHFHPSKCVLMTLDKAVAEYALCEVSCVPCNQNREGPGSDGHGGVGGGNKPKPALEDGH